MSLAEISSLSSKGSFDFTLDSRGKIVKDTFMDTCHKKISSHFVIERAEPIAKILSKSIKELPRVSVEEMAKHPFLKTARLMRKLFPPSTLRENRFLHRMVKHEFAARQGLDYWVTKVPANKGFLNWAAAIRLDAHLDVFNHRLEVVNNEINFVIGDVRIPWHTRREAALDSLNWKATLKEKAQARLYDYELGPCQIDTYDLSQMRPVRKISPPPGRFYFEICVFAPNLGTTGNHSWWRIVNGKTGEVWAFTKYRQDGQGANCGAVRGFEAFAPIDETFPDYKPTATLPVEITEEEFHKLLDYEKSLTGKVLTFNNVNNNCTDEAIRRLALLNITLIPEFSISFWQVFAPRKIVVPVMKANDHLPKFVSAILYLALAILGNLITLYYKGHKIDPCFEKGAKDPTNPTQEIKPLISCPGDIIDKNRINFSSPYSFIKKVIEPLEIFKKEKKIRLQEIGASPREIEDVDYEIDPRWRVSAASGVLQAAEAASPENQ